LPGRNFGTLAALILIASLVRGLRPVRAARLLTVKVPKPTNVTELPRFKLPRMPATSASRARPAAALEMSACLAIWSINSVLFTYAPPYSNCRVRFFCLVQRCAAVRIAFVHWFCYRRRERDRIENSNSYSTATRNECQAKGWVTQRSRRAVRRVGNSSLD